MGWNVVPKKPEEYKPLQPTDSSMVDEKSWQILRGSYEKNSIGSCLLLSLIGSVCGSRPNSSYG
jgi:hypothetical protein